jgi:glycerol-3-phosphate acyltransferase PlsY
MEFAAKVLASYLLGSLVGSLLLGRLRGVDIRKLGSGNAGGTNALRTQGAWFAAGVALIDVGKAWLATRVVAAWQWPFVGESSAALAAWLPVACATAAVLGHVYPLFFGFRGGKGAATWIGALLGIAPYSLLAVLSAWLITVMMIGYVSLATMSAAWLLPFLLIATRPMPAHPLLAFAVVMALFITYTHRPNIARIRAGTEPRAQRLWLLGRGR